MLKLRLQRVGRKHQPIFRLVLTDSKNGPKSGKFLEILGSYDTRKSEKAVLNAEKINYWISKGAGTSDTVHNILVSRGLLNLPKKNVLPQGVINKAKLSKEQPKNTTESVVAEKTE